VDNLEPDPELLPLATTKPIAIDETIPLEAAAMPGDALVPTAELSSPDVATAADPGAEPAPVAEPAAPEPVPALPALVILAGTDADDNLQIMAPGHELRGLAGNDVLISASGGNVLDGGADGDVLCSAGNDTLIGGAGFDRFEIQLADNWAGPVTLADFDANDCLDVIDRDGHGIAGLTVDGATIMLGDIAVAYLPSADLGYLIN